MERFYGRVLSVDGIPSEGRIYVTIEKDTIRRNFSFGDTLWTKNPLHRIQPAFNPGAFDFQDYTAKKTIFHQVYLKCGEFILKPGNKKGLVNSTSDLNLILQKALEKVLKAPKELSIAKALLLGDRNEIPVDLLKQFKGAGAMHILAISGLHVGIIHLILMFLTRPLILMKKGRILRVILVLFGLWIYALITGMGVSAIRAVSMFTLLTFGQSLNRKTSLLNNLVNSAFVLLILNPMFLFDVGFQLSYSALTGIAVVAFLIEKSKRQKKQVSKVEKYLLGLILVSCSAQLGVMPLSLFYFKQFSGLFLISSLLLLPILGITLIFGYSVLLASLFSEIPMIIQKTFHAWLNLINTSIEWLGGMDLLIFRGVFFPFSFCLLTILSVLFLTLGFVKRRASLIYVSGFSLICMQLIWIHQRVGLVRNEKLVVFHQKGESLVARRKGSLLELKNSDQLSERGKKHLEEYSSIFPGDLLIQTEKHGALSTFKFFYVNGSLICLINKKMNASLISALASQPGHPDVVVFSHSPSLNLERLLTRIRPRIAVADGSNHHGFVQRCKVTCQSLGIEFHATRDKGAFLYPE